MPQPSSKPSAHFFIFQSGGQWKKTVGVGGGRVGTVELKRQNKAIYFDINGKGQNMFQKIKQAAVDESQTTLDIKKYYNTIPYCTLRGRGRSGFSVQGSTSPPIHHLPHSAPPAPPSQKNTHTQVSRSNLVPGYLYTCLWVLCTHLDFHSYHLLPPPPPHPISNPTTTLYNPSIHISKYIYKP